MTRIVIISIMRYHDIDHRFADLAIQWHPEIMHECTSRMCIALWHRLNLQQQLHKRSLANMPSFDKQCRIVIFILTFICCRMKDLKYTASQWQSGRTPPRLSPSTSNTSIIQPLMPYIWARHRQLRCQRQSFFLNYCSSKRHCDVIGSNLVLVF